MGIFSENARLYWDAGLPVIPLKRWNSPGKGAGKAPILSEWVAYSKALPSLAMREHWMDSYPNCNIGLPFGIASGLCAIDIDSEDPEVVEAIRKVLPKSPWVRIGRKGMGLIYKWQGQANFKLRDSNNQSLVEFLGFGNQMVMPPSIHPDTGQPYTANTNLWDVLDDILPLPMDVERVLREALEPVMGARGVSLAHTGRSKPLQVVPQGERDIQLVRHAGYLARVVLGIDKNDKFTLAQAIDHMATWVTDFTAGIAGDDMDPEKGVSKLLEFLLKDLEAGKTLPEGWDRGLTEAQLEHPTIQAMIATNQGQRWTFSKARDWLAEKIAERPEDDDWVLARCFELIELVARDENFTDFDFGVLANEIRRQAGSRLALAKPDLTKAFKEARKGDSEMGADHEAIARFVVADMERGGEIRWSQGHFWQWNGSCLKKLEDDDVYMKIAEGVKGNPLARRHNDYTSIVKTVSKIVRKDLVEEFEPGVNFANGFLDLEGVLHDHSPKFGKTFTLPFDYVPARAGEAHKWMEYLENSWGDDPDYTEKVMALQEAFAATMFGLGPKYQRAILLFGKPNTGKTQALEVLRAMMPPEAVCSISPHIWKERFVLAGMVGKTLNVCGELPESATIDGRTFKEVVEGLTQNTEMKMKDAFEFRPQAANWFASNFLPQSTDTSGGFVRRWLILEYNRVVPVEERIPNFAEVLISEEREAIAAWAVQGLHRLVEQREYTLPDSHKARLNEVVRSNNSVVAWLQGSPTVRPTPGHDADARECFDQYVFHMREVSRGFSVSFERFMQMIAEIGHTRKEYHDPMGVLRYKLTGLKVLDTLEAKWGKYNQAP